MKNIIIVLIFSLLSSQDYPYFDGYRAFDYLKKQCDLGPRNPGSKGHKDFIVFIEI